MWKLRSLNFWGQRTCFPSRFNNYYYSIQFIHFIILLFYYFIQLVQIIILFPLFKISLFIHLILWYPPQYTPTTPNTFPTNHSSFPPHQHFLQSTVIIMLDIILMALRALQALFAIIVLGLTAHSTFTLSKSNFSLTPQLTITSRILHLYPFPGQLHALRRRLDPPHTHLPRPGSPLLLRLCPPHTHASSGCSDHALLVCRLHRPRRLDSPPE